MEFVSTENKEILEVSKKYRADVTFIRPKELAEDYAMGINVVLHSMEWLKEYDKQKQYDLIMLLQPTSPLKKSEDIDKAIEYLLHLKKPPSLNVVMVKGFYHKNRYIYVKIRYG